MSPKPAQIKIALLAIIMFLVLPVYAGSTFASQKKKPRLKSPVKKNAVQVIQLRNLEQLKEAFQRDQGKVRLLTILSPT